MIEVLIAADLWPQMLSVSSALILMIIAVFSSAVTAAFGLGGGLIMLAALGSFLPIGVVIPVHGVIQLSSNSTRALLLHHDIDWRIATYYSLGAVMGVLAASQFVLVLDEALMLSILAFFILLLTWGPKPKKVGLKERGYTLAGGVITFATMFIGATGPLAMAVLPRHKMSPQQISATHGSLMVVQNVLKGTSKSL